MNRDMSSYTGEFWEVYAARRQSLAWGKITRMSPTTPMIHGLKASQEPLSSLTSAVHFLPPQKTLTAYNTNARMSAAFDLARPFSVWRWSQGPQSPGRGREQTQGKRHNRGFVASLGYCRA